MKILVSRCLLGEPCRYDGRGMPSPGVVALQQAGHTLVPACPEVLGGLPTPRPPAEVQPDGRVVNRLGEDVTGQYQKGAQSALELAVSQGCTVALLKARSPSCGSRQIYDGTFTGTKIPGQGITAGLLRKAGIQVLDEEELEGSGLL